MIQGLTNSDTVPMTRVPWNEPGIIMKMLDLGYSRNYCSNDKYKRGL